MHFSALLLLSLSSLISAQYPHLTALPSFPFENQTIFFSSIEEEKTPTLTAEITFFRDLILRPGELSLKLNGKEIFRNSESEIPIREYKPWGIEIPVVELSVASEQELQWSIPAQLYQHQPEQTEDLFIRKFWVKRKPLKFKNDKGGISTSTTMTMKRRTELGTFLNKHGLIGVGAEVGVKQGDFSEKILEKWDGKLLYLVDPWAHQGDEYVDIFGNQEQATQDMFMEQTKQRLSKFGDRFEVFRQFSLNATEDFEDQTFDFVYLDAMHEYQHVKFDLQAWWPKVKVGGLFCGHDYKDGLLAHGNFGVISAVDEFAASVGHEAMWTIGASYNWFPVNPVDPSPSWYFFKRHEGVEIVDDDDDDTTNKNKSEL